MFVPDIIRKKRDRKALSKEEIDFFIQGYTEGAIPDYQASALLMSVFLNGMTIDETVLLTEAMLHSGVVVDLGGIQGTKVDKHSTGGVGDKTSLIIAPICAALGVPVPMISGRGLGHSGGTLDKLESIPGFQVNLGLEKYQELVAKMGVCLIGQTKEIAPADKKLYALRDVTATVENKSLISASIMSKKMAEGIDALVLDVKFGRGAFMKTRADAEELASLMMSIGRDMGKKVVALVTAMDQPLGSHIGNSLEVIESIEILKGEFNETRADLIELSLQLAAYMLVLGGRAHTPEEGYKLAKSAIDDGSALEKLKEIVQEQGGDPRSIDDMAMLPKAAHSAIITADRDGYIHQLDAFEIGTSAVILGAGRASMDSIIDPAVGVILLHKIGGFVKAGDPILEVLYNDSGNLDNALSRMKSAIKIKADELTIEPLIAKVLE